MKKVFVGISGGVDSTMAIKILIEKGYAVTGVFMRLFSFKEEERKAKEIADFFKIPFLIFDFRKEFKEKIIKEFIIDFKKGITPNPCVNCNQKIKFGLFLEEAQKRGADFIATGHYALRRGNFIYKAKDSSKDQSYFLCNIPKEKIKFCLFPLGNYFKKEVKEIIKKEKIIPQKESQEICFIKGDPIDYLKKAIKTKKGKIVDDKRSVLGEHEGVVFYTIGQRKGLDLPQGPFFVFKKDFKKNILYVTKDKKNLFKKEVKFKKVNFFIETNFPFKATAKIRYRGKELPCVVYKSKAVFLENQNAIASGQSIVFYQKNKLIGGGTIYE